MASDLIYDWNEGAGTDLSGREIGLVDETLRDGLQSPSIRLPKLDDKLRLLHLMAALGIDDVNIGMLAAGRQFREDALVLAREIFDVGLPLKCHCAARTVIGDIEPIVELSQRVGGQIGVGLFIGSSPIRHYVEGWDEAELMELVRVSVRFAVGHGLRVMFVTEDTTRAMPDTLRKLYGTAIENGATQLVLCDTVGHATPYGAGRLVRFVRELAGPGVGIDWHGHSDRGLALACTLAAIEAGADRIHATALGIGERAGNTPMEQVLVNLQLMGHIEHDLSKLQEYCRLTAEACGVPMPPNLPIVGPDAFRTTSGVHAAALVKALEKGDRWLADRIYSAVPAPMVGREQEIEIGPMSGASNVRYALMRLGVEPEEELVRDILAKAKSSDHILSGEEMLRIVVRFLVGDRRSRPGSGGENRVH